jgi:hypothetical protein
MRDIVRETGLPRSTIHFYLAEGRPPPPTKTGRNTALYSWEHVWSFLAEFPERNFGQLFKECHETLRAGVSVMLFPGGLTQALRCRSSTICSISPALRRLDPGRGDTQADAREFFNGLLGSPASLPSRPCSSLPVLGR